MKILSTNNWFLQGLRFQLNRTKECFAGYIRSHYRYYEKKNTTLPEQYINILKSKLEFDLQKLNGVFNIKVDTLRFFFNLLDSEHGKTLFQRFLAVSQPSNESTFHFIKKATESLLVISIEEKVENTLPTYNKIEGRAICIAVYLYFELEDRLDEYERLYRIGITRTQKFAAEKFKIARIPGKQNMVGFDLNKILTSKNQLKPKNQLKKQLTQIAENKTVFGNKIAARAEQLINKYY